MAGPRTVRLFVSSPGDVEPERQRTEVVAERLNGIYPDSIRFEVIRWENKFYTADRSFQPQISEASECEIVIGIFWTRLGSELPPDFVKMPDGSPYPSGTAYEVLSAIEKKKEKGLGAGVAAKDEVHPDVYIFQKLAPPFPAPKDERDLAVLDTQWRLLGSFIDRWFRTHEGHFLAAFHNFSTTDQFEEQIEKLLRQWMAEHVLGPQAPTWPIATLGSPYCGLDAFDLTHSTVFFGRSRDIRRATEKLKTAARSGAAQAARDEAFTADTVGSKTGLAFLVIVGASGVGKSSLARAGLVPRLTTPGFVPEVDRWRVAIMRPSEAATPFEALAQALFARAGRSPGKGAARCDGLPEIADGDFRKAADLAEVWLGGSLSTRAIEGALDRISESERAFGNFDRPIRTALMLVVDQLDDLFLPEVSQERTARFAALLTALAATGRVWIVATLRAALYERYLTETAFEQLRDCGVFYELGPPSRADFIDIVRKPAEAAGLTFGRNTDGEFLDEKILADAADPDTLPLLQFTLDSLFDERKTVGDKAELTFAAYEAIGGVDGAIDRAAEAALQELKTEEEKEALPRLLRQLVVASGSPAESGEMAMAIRTVPYDIAASTPQATKLVKVLENARILTSEGGGDGATIRVTHQRAVESWRRAREIVRANMDFYRIRRDIEDGYKHWSARGRKSDFLLPAGLPLAEAESVATRFRDEIPPELQDYVKVSGQRARLRQRLTAAAAVVFACVAIAAVFFWKQSERGLVAATDAISALVQVISEDIRPLAQLDTVEELVTQARKSINQFGGVWESDDIRKQHARTYLLVANIDWDRGDLAQMLKDANSALTLLDRLVANGDLESLLLRADAYRLVGVSSFEAENRDDARNRYQQGIADDVLLLDRNPNPDLKWRAQRSLADLYQDLGDVMLSRYNQPRDAIALYDKCAALRKSLIDTGHKSPAFIHDLAWAENKHGDVLVRLGDDASALKSFSLARDELEGLHDYLWDNLIWAYNLSLIYNNVGLIDRRQKRFAEAIGAFDSAEKLAKRVVDHDPKNLGRRAALSWTKLNRSEALFRWALETKDMSMLQKAKAGFTESNEETAVDAKQAPLEARVQLGYFRGRAYIAAIDATMKEWSDDNAGAAAGFAEAANLIISKYLPHVNEFPRRDYLSEAIEYLDWAANADASGGNSADARRRLEQAGILIARYRDILGDKVSATLQEKVENDLAKLH
jgi:tetratricopeptide (TPR) repeat protein